MSARAVLAVVLMTISLASPAAAMRISDDQGGQIGEYLARFKALKLSGERIIIDGTCASACTMLLGVIPRDRICVTSRAVLAFHSAWDPTPDGTRLSAAGNQYLWSNYPDAVRKWISQHGGLRSRLIYLRGSELAAMYPTCR